MAFPTSPSDGDTYTNALGVQYKYVSADTKWTIQSQAVTGNQGIQGVTGANFSQSEYQNGTMGGAGVVVNWANGYKQHQPVGFTGSYYNIGFAGGATGMNGTLRVSYIATQAPGITGCSWPNAVRPTLSGATGAQDIVTVYYNGTTYFAQASLAFGVA